MTTTAVAPAEQKNGSGGIAVKSDPRIMQFKHTLESSNFKAALASALPKHVSAERMIRVVLGAMQRVPQLLECTPNSVLLSVMQSAALGLQPDGLMGEGYLVPYGKTCTFIAGYRGLMKLARQSGEVVQIWTEVVYERDHFRYELGLDPKLEHRRNDDVDDAGSLRYVYAVARFRDDSKQFVVLNRREVEKIRSSSAAAKSGSSPWKTHEPEMWKKTAVRRLCKLLPLSADTSEAIAKDSVNEIGDMAEFGAVIESPQRGAIEDQSGERDPNDEPDQPDATGELPSLATLADELAAVTMISDVTTIENKYLTLLPDDHIEVGIACADRRNEIKASRGGKKQEA